MRNRPPEGFDALTGAWREFQTWTPVKLGTVEGDRHYRAMVDFMNDLLDEVGDRETHPLIGLLEIVGCFVREYDEANADMPNLSQHTSYEDVRKSSVPGLVSRSSSAPQTRDRFDTPKPMAVDVHPGLRLALPRPGGYADFMKRVEIDLPDETFASLDRESAELAAEFRAAAAAKWYEVGRVSQEMAAQIAGVGRGEFLTILSRLQVSPMQESPDEALASARLLLQP